MGWLKDKLKEQDSGFIRPIASDFISVDLDVIDQEFAERFETFVYLKLKSSFVCERNPYIHKNMLEDTKRQFIKTIYKDIAYNIDLLSHYIETGDKSKAREMISIIRKEISGE